MYQCFICYEEREEHDKVKLSCSHELCERCYQEVLKKFNNCPFCRSSFTIKEMEDPDPEEWLYLDPNDWIVYSKTDRRYGTENIYVYHKDERQPSWRNDALVLNDKRIRTRKKRKKNRY